MVALFRRGQERKTRTVTVYDVNDRGIFQFKYATGGSYFIRKENIIGMAESFEEIKIKYPEYYI